MAQDQDRKVWIDEEGCVVFRDKKLDFLPWIIAHPDGKTNLWQGARFIVDSLDAGLTPYIDSDGLGCVDPASLARHGIEWNGSKWVYAIDMREQVEPGALTTGYAAPVGDDSLVESVADAIYRSHCVAMRQGSDKRRARRWKAMPVTLLGYLASLENDPELYAEELANYRKQASVLIFELKALGWKEPK